MTHAFSVLSRGLVSAALAAASLSAGAALLSYDANFNITQADITITASNLNGSSSSSNSGPRNSSQVLSLSRFDAGLGTLQGVSISLTSAFGATTSLQVSFVDGSDAPQLQLFKVEGPLGGSLTGLSGLYSRGFASNPSASCGFPSLTGTTCSQIEYLTGSLNTPQAFSGADLAAFIGSGSFNLTATLDSSLMAATFPDNGTSFVDNASLQGSMSGINWAGTVKVTYDYLASTGNPIPETLSLYLVMAGLAAVAWRRRQG